MAGTLYDSQEGFAGGYNANGAKNPVDPSQFSAMTNVRLVREHEMAKRPGMKQALSYGTNQPTAISPWRKDSGSSDYQIVICDTSPAIKVATYSPVTGLLTVSSTTTPAVSRVGDSSAAFVHSATDELYLSDVGDKVYALVQATKLGSGTPDNIRSLWVYNQRLFGCTATNQTLYWSALNDGNTLGDTANGGGSATIRTFGGGVLRGGFALGGMNVLVADTALSVFRGRTFDDIQIAAGAEGLSPAVGAISPAEGESWKVIDEVGYIVSTRGLFTLTEASGLTPYIQPGLTDPIAELILSSKYASGRGIADNPRRNEIWFGMDASTISGTASSYIFIYSKILRRFTGQITFPSGAPQLLHLATGGNQDLLSVYPQIFVALSNGSNYYIAACDFADPSLEVFQDLSVNYTSSVGCRRFFTENQRETKAWDKAFVLMGSGGLGSQSAGASTGATLSATMPIGGAISPATALTAGLVAQVPLSGSGAYMDATITDGGLSSTGWSVASVEVTAADNGLVGQ